MVTLFRSVHSSSPRLRTDTKLHVTASNVPGTYVNLAISQRICFTSSWSREPRLNTVCNACARTKPPPGPAGNAPGVSNGRIRVRGGARRLAPLVPRTAGRGFFRTLAEPRRSGRASFRIVLVRRGAGTPTTDAAPSFRPATMEWWSPTAAWLPTPLDCRAWPNGRGQFRLLHVVRVALRSSIRGRSGAGQAGEAESRRGSGTLVWSRNGRHRASESRRATALRGRTPVVNKDGRD
jgi:hypothetical protein